jgi:radical SAM protein with 4Fe4S-binding SPASM domain
MAVAEKQEVRYENKSDESISKQTPNDHLKNRLLPDDCTFLPLTNGQLLVSREHAKFCPVAAEDMPALLPAIAQKSIPENFNPALLKKLERHGFFDPPRQPKPGVKTVQLQLTNTCNIACSYCCTNSGNQRKEELSYADLLHVVEQIPDTIGRKTVVSLMGGEPLMVPWALDLAEAVLKMGLPLSFFTNGILLEDDRIAKRTAQLTQQGMKLRVSLGGATPESCDLISGSYRFEPVLKGLKNLALFGGDAALDLMFTPQNSEEVAAKLPYLREQLPESMNISLGILYVSGRETGEHLFSSQTELEAALDHVAFEAGVSVPVAQASPLTYRRDGCNCALGKHIHVRSDGYLFNCYKMEEVIGHLKTSGFAAAARQNIENPHPASNLPTCADCALVTICGGGCRSENYLYTGNPDVPPCGPWRVRVISELLADEIVTSVKWPVAFLAQEALKRGIDIPDDLAMCRPSRHLIEI